MVVVDLLPWVKASKGVVATKHLSLQPVEEVGRRRGPAKDFKVLWASADKLRAQMDAAEYKHLVLGLIFLKYISDTFLEQQQKVLATVSNPESDYYLGDDPADHQEALEDRDYYTQENVFWVPADARWESLRNQAKQSDIGQLIDGALVAIENENPTLRGKLDKRFGAAQLEPGRMGELVDLISTIGFGEGKKSGDVLGEVYEYFLVNSPVPRARRADSSIRLPMWSRPWLLCWHLTRVGFMTPAVDRAACSSKASVSSKVTAVVVTTSPSMGRRATPPPGGWQR